MIFFLICSFLFQKSTCDFAWVLPIKLLLRMTTRASDILFKLGEETAFEVTFKRRGPLDFSKCVQIPSNKEVIERYFTIKNDLPQNEPTVSTSLNAVSDQLCTEWVHMNIPSVQSKNVRKHHLEPLLEK